VTVLEPRGGSRSAIALAAAVATVAVLPVFLTGALAVQVRADLRFDEAGLGLTVAAFFGAAACTSAIAGRFAERLGPGAAMGGAALLSALSLAAVAVAARSLATLLACLVVGGVSNALAQPATNLFLAQRVRTGRLGLAFGVKQSAIPMSTFLGGAAVPAVALTVGWRWAYVAAAVVAAALALPTLLTPSGARAPRRPRGAGRSHADTALRPLLVLAVGCGLGAAAAGTLGSFLVSAAVDAGIAEGRAGILAGVCSLAGVATRMSAGALADRRRGRHLATVARMLALGSIGYLMLAAAEPALLVVGALLGFCLGWGWPGLFNMAIVRNNPQAPGAASGITQTGTYTGAVLGPLAFGLAAQHLSYPHAWAGTAVVSFAAAAVVVAGRRLLRADRSRRAEETPAVPPL
jgi:MFS family permease